jgi:hypothetical protein
MSFSHLSPEEFEFPKRCDLFVLFRILYDEQVQKPSDSDCVRAFSRSERVKNERTHIPCRRSCQVQRLCYD